VSRPVAKRSTVAQRVKRIEAMSGDCEAAHSEEDKLFIDVLTSIADGTTDDARGIAREALKSRLLDFSRWYA
jgi:hypothetical protein